MLHKGTDLRGGIMQGTSNFKAITQSKDKTVTIHMHNTYLHYISFSLSAGLLNAIRSADAYTSQSRGNSF